jgi:TRAP-type C4-dicarboxylate transport system permease small subunit
MPLAWSEELVRYVYIGVSFLGASIAVREKSHICIDFLPLIVKGILKKRPGGIDGTIHFFDILGNIIGILFWVYIVSGIVTYMLDLKEKGMLSVANDWPMWIVMLPIVICGSLMVVHYLLNTAEIFEPKEPTEEAEKGDLAQ